MKKVLLFALLCQLVLNSYGQDNSDSSQCRISGYKLVDGTFSYRSSGSFFDKTTWDSSPYEQGHLRDGANKFCQNYRFLRPLGYDQSYEPGYPLIVVFHGSVERANCYNGNCYVGTADVLTNDNATYDRNTTPSGTTTQINNLLNNDHHLINGGQAHLTARNAAGTKKPDDPSLNSRAFPGFVVFPQMFNGWAAPSPNNDEARHALRIVRLMIKKYNIDPNRVYIHGLSVGGNGVLQALIHAEWLFAAAAPMSAVRSHTPFKSDLISSPNNITTVPMWFFQGGKDGNEFGNPYPSDTDGTVAAFRAAGGVTRYSLYPSLGHNVWVRAYDEPDFFSWMLSQNRSDIQVAFGIPLICESNPAPAVLRLPQGYYAYQWERDGVIIPGANSSVYSTTTPGVYRARFCRSTSTPTEAQYNRWSKPVTVTVGSPPKPVISQTGTVKFKDLNGSNDAKLSVTPSNYPNYKWYRKGELLTSAASYFTSNSPSITFTNNKPRVFSGDYTVTMSTYNNCPSPPSDPKYVFFNDSAAINNTMRPSSFTGTVQNFTNIELRWNDVSGTERNYEIWRKSVVGTTSSPWTLVSITPEDDVLFVDTNLASNTTYWYKIRAINNTQRSEYFPGNSKTSNSQNLRVTTGLSPVSPSAPQNLTAVVSDTDINAETASVNLTWQAPGGTISGYRVKFNGVTIDVPATPTTYTWSGVPLNSLANFTVASLNVSNVESPPSNQATASTYLTGLFWTYSSKLYVDLTSIPDEEWINGEYNGRATNLDLSHRTQDENFIFRFYGYLDVTNDGDYFFKMNSNDGVQLFIDGTLALSRNELVEDGDCVETNSLAVPLAPGRHTIEVRHFQYQGNSCLSLDWKGPDAGPDQEAFYPFPAGVIRSYPVDFTPPAPPDAPVGVNAETAPGTNGMTQINLTWSFTGLPDSEFEVYRSLSKDGPFAIINTVSAMTFADQNLTPETEYFYKLRAINDNGSSVYSELDSATTASDLVAPTEPLMLTLYSQAQTSASIGWTAATDNTAVTGYEIWLSTNGSSFVLNSTTTLTSRQVTGLSPAVNYQIYIIAYDSKGNKSDPSNTISFTTSVSTVYYSKATGPLNDVLTWGENANGSGASPSDFTTNGAIYTIDNRENTTTNVGGSWTIEGAISKIVVTEDIELSAESSLAGRMEVVGNAKVIFNNNTTPTFVSISPTSTIQYNSGATLIQAATYGNLILNGSGGTGSKTFASNTTTVLGDITVTNGLSLRGATSNQSTVILYGDLIVPGSLAPVLADVSLTMDFRKPGTQTLNINGTLDFFRIITGPTTNFTLTNSGTAGTLNLGSVNGGGLSIGTGSTFSLGNNLLHLNGGSINNAGETGQISVSGGSIDIVSSATQNSNLYFHPTNKTLASLGVYLSGTGIAQVQSPVNVTDDIRIQDGSLYSNGNITMISTDLKTANLREIERTGHIYGNVNVERYFDVKARLYRYISSPVVGTKVSDWQNFFSITGDFDGTSSGPGLGTTASMFYYANDTYTAYPSRSYNQDNAALIVRGVGYSTFIRNTTAFTLTNTGNPHQGTIPFPVVGPAVSTTSNGWQLLGNPYASVIAWSNDEAEWTKSGMSNSVAVRENINSTTSQYRYYDASTSSGDLLGGRIAPGQAFWVRAVNSTPSLSIHEGAKVSEQKTFYREGETNTLTKIQLNLKQGATSDPAFIVLTNFGTDNYDAQYDAVKNPNTGMFNFSTLTTGDAQRVAINNASDEFCTKSVKLDIRNASAGTYSISIEDLESLIGVGEVNLVDNFTGTTADLRAQSYSFAVTSDAASFGSNRFVLNFNRPVLDMKNVSLSSAAICGTPGQVQIANPQKGVMYTLLNENNQEISAAQTSFGESLTFEVSADKVHEGINEVRVRGSFKGCASSVSQAAVQIEYLPTPIVSADDQYTCSGEKVQINASSSSLGVMYNWYTHDNVKLKGNSTSSLMVDVLTEEVSYSVAAVLPNGCEGPREYVTISPVTLETPELTMADDVLTASVSADEFTWTRNGEVFATTTKNQIVVSEPGTYGVTARLVGCSKSAREYVVTATEGDQDFRYNVFPNPTSSDNIYLQVVAGSNEDVKVRMVDLVGREVYANLFNTEQLKESVQLSPATRLRAGVYIVMLEQKTRIRKIKLIVKE